MKTNDKITTRLNQLAGVTRPEGRNGFNGGQWVTSKEATGRNTATRLAYYSGYMALILNKPYAIMDIHERITVKSAYGGHNPRINQVMNLGNQNK